MTYRISFTIPGDELATVLGLLGGASGLDSLSVARIEDAPAPRRVRRTSSTTLDGGVLARYSTCLALETMKHGPDNPWSLAEIGKAFEADGKLSPRSASPVLSGLHRNGLVERVAQSLYRLTPEGRAFQ